MEFYEENTNQKFEIKIYPFYTDKILKNYISKILFSKPYYISLKGKRLQDLSKDSRNEVIDLQKIIEKVDEQNYMDNFNIIKNYVEQGYFKEEIVYLLFNKYLAENIPEEMLNNIITILNSENIDLDFTNTDYEPEDDNEDDPINDVIEAFVESDKKENYRTSEVKKISSTYLYRIPTRKSLMYIFDNIRVSKDMPLVYLNDYYKVYKNSNALKENNFKKDTICTYMYDNDEYTAIYITLYNYEMYVSFETSNDSTKESVLELIDSNIDIILISSTPEIEYIQDGENSVKDVTFELYYDVKVSKELFLEMITNEPLINRIINTREYEKTKTSNKYMKRGRDIIEGNEKSVFTYFSSSLGNFNIIFGSKRVDKKLMAETKNIFNQNDLVLYVKIRKYNLEDQSIIINFINSILKYYTDQTDYYIDDYSEFLPDYVPNYPKEIIETKIDYLGLMNQMGFNDASSRCSKNKRPNVLTDNQLKELLESENKTVEQLEDASKLLKINKDNNDWYLACNDPTLYIDYVKNYEIPCCRQNIKNKNKKTTTEYQNIKNTILGEGKVSQFIPKNIKNIIELYDSNNIIDISLLRAIGCSDQNTRRLSFLGCIRKATNNKPVNIDSYKDVLKFYKNHKGIVKQEMYNYNDSEIVNMIKYDYMDPKLFLRILEFMFKINIILVSDSFNDGDFTNPFHAYNYLKFKNDNPYCIVWEHMKDNIISCELIAMQTPSNNYTYIFNQYEDIYNILHNNINKNHKVFLDCPKFDPNTIISQEVDDYGKCRKINLKFKNTLYSIFTDPLPPFPVNIDTTIHITPKNKLFEFIQSTGSFIINETSSKVQFVNNGTKMYAHTQEPVKSIFTTYNTNKKIATHLVEYFCWFYSKYVQDTNDTDVINFVDKKIRIDPTHTYKINNNDFENPTIINKNKFLINSELLLKKLVYVLKLRLEREEKFILDYHNYENSDRLFINIQDFNSLENEIILYGKKAFNNWTSRSKEFLFKDCILHSNKNNQYIKNPLMDNKKFLMIHTETFKDSLRKSLSLYLKRPISNPIKITIYSYINENNIEKKILNPQGNDYNVYIVKYIVTKKYKNTGKEVKVPIFNTLIEL